MNSFKEITTYINSDLENFENLLVDITNSHNGVLNEILDYIFESKGKRIRPILVYLIARLFSEPTKSTHNAALLVEIIHTATLLHDDVVDEAVLRRGKPTLNYKWDDKTAILSGDFLFAKAMKIATDNEEYKLFDIITPAVMSLSLGELLQMKYSKSFDIDEDKYFEVIKYKTASLISVCCESGAYTVNATEKNILLCKEFGEILGYIFQIKDDVLDYVGNGTGKETGIDIKEKKITLPLICAWKNMNEIDRKKLISLWDSADNDLDPVYSIIQIVIDNEGISGCNKEMRKLKDKALGILNNFKDSKARSSLVYLLDYIIERDK